MVCEPSTSSGLKSADAAVSTRNCILTAVTLIADGTNAASLTIYDNTAAAAGTVLCKLTAVAGQGTITAVLPEGGIIGQLGLYADLNSSAGTHEYVVSFRTA